MRTGVLTRQQIVHAAVAVLDADGLEGLNMRALGKHLGSVATAVYWHVRGKRELISLAGDSVWDEIPLPDPSTVGWRQAAISMATELHAMLTRHPWVAQAFGSYLIYGPARARRDDHTLAIYEGAGFSGARAEQAAAVVLTYVLGNALGGAAATSLRRTLSREGGDPEQRMAEAMTEVREVAAQFPHLRARMDQPSAGYATLPEDSFAFGLEVIVEGLQARLAPTNSARRRR